MENSKIHYYCKTYIFLTEEVLMNTFLLKLLNDI